MSKEEQVKQIISDYLYTRDDVFADLNDVSEIVDELVKRLVVL